MNIYYEYYYNEKLIARDERKTCSILANDPIYFDNIPCEFVYAGSYQNCICFQFNLLAEPSAIYNICPMKG